MEEEQKRLPIDETERKTAEEPESIIKITLDIFNIRKFVKIIFEKIHINTTNQFIDGLLIIIFLFILYKYINILNMDTSWPMIILYVIILFVILDFLGANSSLVKKYLFTEENNRIFLEKVNTYTENKIKKEIKIRSFSPTNIAYYLNYIKNNPSKNIGFIFDNILIRNPLSPANWDLICSQEILQFMHEYLMIGLLVKYRGMLSISNISNLYQFYRDNDTILKMICATQKEAELLVKLKSDDSKLKQYFEQFQIHQSQDFLELKNKIPEDDSVQPGLYFLLFIAINFFIIIGICMLLGISPIAVIGSNIGLFGVIMISMFFAIPPTNKFADFLASRKNKKIIEFIDYVKKVN